MPEASQPQLRVTSTAPMSEYSLQFAASLLKTLFQSLIDDSFVS